MNTSFINIEVFLHHGILNPLSCHQKLKAENNCPISFLKDPELYPSVDSLHSTWNSVDYGVRQVCAQASLLDHNLLMHNHKYNFSEQSCKVSNQRN